MRPVLCQNREGFRRESIQRPFPGCERGSEMTTLGELCKRLPESRKADAERYLRSLIALGPAGESSSITWLDAFNATKRKGEKPSPREEIVAVAEAILKRPPVAQDLDTDFAQLLLRRIDREKPAECSDVYNYLSVRLKYLKRLGDYFSKSLNMPAVEWSKIAIARRINNDLELAEAREEAEPSKESLCVLDKPIQIESAYREIPVIEVVKRYCNQRLVGKSPNSIRLLYAAEKKYSNFLGRPAVIRDFNNDQFGRWISDMLRNGSHETALRNQERLNSLWRFASQRGWIPTQPTLPLVRVPNRIPEAWTAEQMQAIIAAVELTQENMAGVMSNVPYALYWKALIYFLYDTAERIGAVLEVTFADVSGEWVTVRAEGRKGKTGDKRFKLRPETIELIKRLRKLSNSNQVERIFHWPQNPTYIYSKFKKVLDAAELPASRRNMFHKFRRTAASDFEAAGGNATKLLDHRNRATTAKYLDPRAINEVMPADIVPAIGESKAKGSLPISDAEILSKMRQLLQGA